MKFVPSRRLCFVLAAAALFGGGPIASVAAEEKPAAEKSEAGFPIFRDGVATTSISVPKDAPSDVKIAVEVFQRALKEGYNIDLPLSEGSDLSRRIEIVPENLSLLKDDKAVIDFPNEETLRITGGEAGIIHALFWLLEKNGGVRYLYQGAYGDGQDRALCTYYPEVSEIIIPREREELKTAYPLGRSLSDTSKYFGGKEGEVRRYFWGWQAQLGAKSPVSLHHNMGAGKSRERVGREDQGILFPIDLYVKDGVYPPDEVFPILKGKRYLPYKKPEGRSWYAHWEPCFTNKATEDEAVKNILAFLEKHPETKSISLSVNDNGGHCECDVCLKTDSGKTNAYFMPDRSESYYQWVNKVVERVTEKYPDMMFGLIAYREVYEPPTFKLHPNVAVILTMDMQSTIAPEIKKKQQEVIRRWADKAQNIGFWAYDVGPLNYSLPRFFVQAEQEMIQDFQTHNGTVAFAEGAHYFTITEGPRVYMYFKMLENPDMDRESVMRDWCKAAVGEKAAGPLYDYYAFWEDYWRTKATKVDQFWDRRGQTYLQRGHFSSYVYGLEQGDLAHCRELMEKVVADAREDGTDAQKQRAELLMKLFDWYEAAGIATSAEYIDPSGLVPNAENAVALLKHIPDAVKARNRWSEVLKTTPEWIAADMILDRQDRLGVVPFNMAQVAPFAQVPEVRAELEKLAADNKLPATIQQLAEILLLPDTAANPENRIMALNFAAGDAPKWSTTANYGKMAVGTAPDGQSALQISVEHPNFTAKMPIPNGKPGADYFAKAKIFIPAPNEGAPASNGSVEFWGQPLYVGWNQPALRLTPGTWHEVYAYIPAEMSAQNEDQLAGELGGVANTAEIKAMDSLQLMLRLKGFENGTKMYLKDLQVFELPAEKKTVASQASK